MAGDAPRQRDVRGVVIGVHELEKLRRKLTDLAAKVEGDTTLAKAMGAQQVASAQRRIRETKRSPEGKRWPKWSEKYAKTRKRQHSLLVERGHLAQSMTYEVRSAAEVIVGSNMRYAATHLYGDPARNIPARPYLDTGGGFADPSDRAELRDIVRDYLRKAGL